MYLNIFCYYDTDTVYYQNCPFLRFSNFLVRRSSWLGWVSDIRVSGAAAYLLHQHIQPTMVVHHHNQLSSQYMLGLVLRFGSDAIQGYIAVTFSLENKMVPRIGELYYTITIFCRVLLLCVAHRLGRSPSIQQSIILDIIYHLVLFLHLSAAQQDGGLMLDWAVRSPGRPASSQPQNWILKRSGQTSLSTVSHPPDQLTAKPK